MGFIEEHETESFDRCVGVHETAAALLVQFPNGRECWVPKSVITDDSEVYEKKDGSGTLIVKRWFAEKEGLG